LPAPAQTTTAVNDLEANAGLFEAYDGQNAYNFWNEQNPKSKVADEPGVVDLPLELHNKQGVVKSTADGLIVKSGRTPVATADENPIDINQREEAVRGVEPGGGEVAETAPEHSGTEGC